MYFDTTLTPGVRSFCVSVNWIQFALNVLTFAVAMEEFIRVYLIRGVKTRVFNADVIFWFHILVILHPLLRAIATFFLEHACVPITDESSSSRILLSLANYIYNAAFFLIIVKWSQLVHKHRSGRRRAFGIFVACDIIFCGVLPLVMIILISIIGKFNAEMHLYVLMVELYYFTALNACLALLFGIYGFRAQFVVKKLLARRRHPPSTHALNETSLEEQITPHSSLRTRLFVQTVLALGCFVFRTVVYIIMSVTRLTPVTQGIIVLIKDGIGDCGLTIILLFLNIPTKTRKKKLNSQRNQENPEDDLNSITPKPRKPHNDGPTERDSLLINENRLASAYALFYKDEQNFVREGSADQIG
ncbi:hypothetical protein BLNAU_16523 [Blattamonas nauphoetae]|uniref:Uncharacterized protein n=1 Tax=Blattamonas nauphoetae TaxID=2049346 RepID=A0ABQ9XD06_9EUKA|nr:hypothetical protein BLNAU_16523 [Blattamonas nauphoetae]